MADADPDDARERQVPRRHRRGSEQQRCPPGPRYEPLDGGHGAQGLRVVGLAKKAKYLYDEISSARVRQGGLLSAASRQPEQRRWPSTQGSEQCHGTTLVICVPKRTRVSARTSLRTSHSPISKSRAGGRCSPTAVTLESAHSKMRNVADEMRAQTRRRVCSLLGDPARAWMPNAYSGRGPRAAALVGEG